MRVKLPEGLGGPDLERILNDSLKSVKVTLNMVSYVYYIALDITHCTFKLDNKIFLGFVCLGQS